MGLRAAFYCIWTLNSSPSPINSLTICHLNAQSLWKHIDEIRFHFQSEFYDIIAVSETWLSSDIFDTQVSLVNYTLVRFDRFRHGGGVAIFLKKCLEYTNVQTSSLQHLLNAVKLLAIQIK